jgi:hypothetical protein
VADQRCQGEAGDYSASIVCPGARAQYGTAHKSHRRTLNFATSGWPLSRSGTWHTAGHASQLQAPGRTDIRYCRFFGTPRGLGLATATSSAASCRTASSAVAAQAPPDATHAHEELPEAVVELLDVREHPHPQMVWVVSSYPPCSGGECSDWMAADLHETRHNRLQAVADQQRPTDSQLPPADSGSWPNRHSELRSECSAESTSTTHRRRCADVAY